MSLSFAHSADRFDALLVSGGSDMLDAWSDWMDWQSDVCDLGIGDDNFVKSFPLPSHRQHWTLCTYSLLIYLITLHVSFSVALDFLTLKEHLRFERLFHKLSRLSPPHQVVYKISYMLTNTTPLINGMLVVVMLQFSWPFSSHVRVRSFTFVFSWESADIMIGRGRVCPGPLHCTRRMAPIRPIVP